MKIGMTKADEKVTKKTGTGLAKALLKVVGIGLAAGVALIAVTDKTMKKAFPQDEAEDKPEGGCRCTEGAEADDAEVDDEEADDAEADDCCRYKQQKNERRQN